MNDNSKRKVDGDSGTQKYRKVKILFVKNLSFTRIFIGFLLVIWGEIYTFAVMFVTC